MVFSYTVGRRVNDKMGKFIGEKVLKLMEDNAIEIKNSRSFLGLL